jgi:tripartite-type tricarboxylate transporter receptor subunit TctC
MKSMNRIIKYAGIGAAALALAGMSSFAKAQSVNYKGRTVTIVIGYGFGGTYGKYARLMAKHMQRFIKGKPNIVVQSMSGAGGIKATNYAANVMPPNGLNWIVPPDASVVSQLLRPKRTKYDMRKFTSLGSTNQTNTIFVLRSDSGVRKWDDMKRIEVITGNTGPGSTSFLIPKMMKEMLGLKIKLISGYKGSSKTIMSMEQGEHQGTGFNWLAWSSKVPHWFKGDKPFARAILQTGVWKDPDLDKNVPMLKDVVEDKYQPIVSFMATLGIIGRGLALPPGAPKDIVPSLRAAFDKMVADDKYKAEAKKRKLRVIATKGADVQKFINNAINNVDKKVAAAASEMIFGKKTN